MTDAPNSQTADNTEKDPEEWTTGNEPATGAQLSYLRTMASEANETVPDTLTKAAASELIEKLQAQTGRGPDSESK